MSTFQKELETIINRYSMEQHSDTPDFILAQYLNGCLENFGKAVKLRDSWYGVNEKKNADATLVTDAACHPVKESRALCRLSIKLCGLSEDDPAYWGTHFLWATAVENYRKKQERLKKKTKGKK